MSDFELSIRTRDGYVFTILTDKPFSLGESVVESIIVQPQEEYAVKAAQRGDPERLIYGRDINGEWHAMHKEKDSDGWHRWQIGEKT